MSEVRLAIKYYSIQYIIYVSLFICFFLPSLSHADIFDSLWYHFIGLVHTGPSCVGTHQVGGHVCFGIMMSGCWINMVTISLSTTHALIG